MIDVALMQLGVTEIHIDHGFGRGRRLAGSG
jgi:hypothetical protein